MDVKELHRLMYLREIYDKSLKDCNPLEFAYRQQNLLEAIAEHLLQPLQEHEFAERSKLPKPEEYEDLLKLANEEVTMWRLRFINSPNQGLISAKKAYADNVFMATPIGQIENPVSYYSYCLKEYDENKPS